MNDSGYGIWNPNTNTWVKLRKTDRFPARYGTRDMAQRVCDAANAKYGR